MSLDARFFYRLRGHLDVFVDILIMYLVRRVSRVSNRPFSCATASLRCRTIHRRSAVHGRRTNGVAFSRTRTERKNHPELCSTYDLEKPSKICCGLPPTAVITFITHNSLAVYQLYNTVHCRFCPQRTFRFLIDTRVGQHYAVGAVVVVVVVAASGRRPVFDTTMMMLFLLFSFRRPRRVQYTFWRVQTGSSYAVPIV